MTISNSKGGYQSRTFAELRAQAEARKQNQSSEQTPQAAAPHPRQAEPGRDVLGPAILALAAQSAKKPPISIKPMRKEDDDAEGGESQHGTNASVAASDALMGADAAVHSDASTSDGPREYGAPERQAIRSVANSGIRPAIRPATQSLNPTANPVKPNITSTHRPGMPRPPMPRPYIRPAIKPAIRPPMPVSEPIPQAPESCEPVQFEDMTAPEQAALEVPPALPMVSELSVLDGQEEDKQPEQAMPVESAVDQAEQAVEVADSSPPVGEAITVANPQLADKPFPGTQSSVTQAVEAAFKPHTMGAFSVGEDCLTFQDEGGTVQVTATRVHVSFMCSEANGKGHGFCLTWLNRNGKECSKVITMPRLVSDWTALLGELSDEGLFVLSPRHLKQYLLETCSRTTLPEVRLITEIGFFPLNPEDLDGPYGFMLPSGAILPVEASLGKVKASELRYRAPFEHKALAAYQVSGTHEEWKEGIAPAEGNTLVVFCTCAVLGAVMLKVYGGENCGFHLYGLSSTGKSTAAQVGMSVLGCAADPQSSSKPTTFGSWSATDNGREIMAACANGAALFLDELDSSPKGASLTVYPLLNGVGKVRMRGTGSMALQHAWRLMVLSTGELSLYERIMREPQREAMLGELSRFLDIPVDNLSRNALLTVEQAQALALQLKQRSGEYYGSACVAFVQWLFAHYPTQGGLRAALLKAIDTAQVELVERLASRRHLRAAHKRAIRHFALVLAVGRWAAEGVLPFSVASIESAVFAMADAWCDGFPSLTDEDRVLDSFRAYFRDQRDSVVCTSGATEEEQCGRTPKILLHDGRLYLAPDCFQQACGELPVIKAGKILDRLEILHRHNNEGQKVKMTIWPSLFRNQRYYALDAARLLGEGTLADFMGGTAQPEAAARDDNDDDQGEFPTL